MSCQIGFKLPVRPIGVFVIATALAALLSSCQTSSSTPSVAPATSCATPDNIDAVSAGNLCLGARTFASVEPVANPDLVILLHGDVSDGGPADYMYSAAAGIAEDNPGSVVVALLRPGYGDGQGRQSTGQTFGRRDHYTPENVDAVAAAIDELRVHHSASRVVVVGHSGGAAIAGVMIGRHPQTADAALLLSCPCDIDRWRADRGRSAWTRSLSPSDFVDAVPVDTEVIALTGARDDRTGSHLARDFVAQLEARGVDARFATVATARHGFRTLWGSHAREALATLVES